MADRSNLIEHVKEWIHLDNDLKELRAQMKENRNRKKQITSINDSKARKLENDLKDLRAQLEKEKNITNNQVKLHLVLIFSQMHFCPNVLSI